MIISLAAGGSIMRITTVTQPASNDGGQNVNLG
jgi:hypothetical protein